MLLNALQPDIEGRGIRHTESRAREIEPCEIAQAGEAERNRACKIVAMEKENVQMSASSELRGEVAGRVRFRIALGR